MSFLIYVYFIITSNTKYILRRHLELAYQCILSSEHPWYLPQIIPFPFSLQPSTLLFLLFFPLVAFTRKYHVAPSLFGVKYIHALLIKKDFYEC